MKHTLFLCLVGSILFTSCQKADNSATQTITPAIVNSTVVTGNWRVTYYFDTDHDETASFAGYEFIFGANGVVTANKAGTTVTGTWSSGYDDSRVKLILSFTSPASFSEISDDWHVIERTNSKIRLQDVSGGNGGTDYLTFEKN
jgi:hypothetical protein